VPYDVNHVLRHAEIAGWALGALDPVDAAAFEAHMRSCGQCQAAAAELEPVAKALGRAAPAVEPPDDLGARTIARVLAAATGAQDATRVRPIPAAFRIEADEQDATRVRPIPGAFRIEADEQDATRVRPIPAAFRPDALRPDALAPDASAPDASAPEASAPDAEPRARGARGAGGATVIRFPRWPGHGRWVAVTSAVAVAVAAAVIAFLVIAPGSGLPANAVAFTLSPASASAAGHAASATATGRPDASGSWDVTLTVTNLPVLRGQDYYECWYVRPGRAGRPAQYASAGTFVVGNGGSRTFSMTSGVDPHEFPRMEIHAESPGATSPQGPAILTGTVRT
jgi:hypothetical protein